MITAEEFLRNEYQQPYNKLEAINCEGHRVQFMMIEFAKIHVKAALKAACNNVEVICDGCDVYQYINDDSILNAYSLTDIK